MLTRRLFLYTNIGIEVPSHATIDSDLEAFSHYQADDSFAALAIQPTALPNI